MLSAQGSRGVILQTEECPESVCGKFLYINGSVTLLNKVEDNGTPLILAPFLYGKYLESIEILNVFFGFNFVYDANQNPSQFSSFSVLYQENFYFFSLIHCEFRSNFATAGLIAINSNTNLPKYVNDSGIAYVYDRLHIELLGLLVEDNIGETSLIHMKFSADLLNIVISGIVLRNNAIKGAHLVYIQNANAPSQGIVTGQFELSGNSEQDKIWIPLRFISIQSVEITDILSFETLFFIQQCANIRISHVKFTNNGDYDSAAYARVIAAYSLLSSAQPPPLPSRCSKFVWSDGSINLSLDNLAIADNRCSSGLCGVAISGNAGIAQISDYLSTNNTCASGGGLAVDSPSNATIDIVKMLASGNTNEKGSIGHFGAGSRVSISESRFTLNTGMDGAVFSFEDLAIFTSSRVEFSENTAPNSLGGAMYWKVGGLNPSLLSIESNSFSGNFASRGGALAFEGSTSAFLQLQLFNCSFVENNADILGAAIYFGRFLSFLENSAITHSLFHSHSSQYSVLYLWHSGGFLLIADSLFQNNSASVVSSIYIETQPEAHTVLENVIFVSNPGGPAIMKSNFLINSTFETKNCTFANNPGTAVVMEGGYWQDHGSFFTGSHESAVLLTSKAYANLSLSFFLSNSADVSGGAIHIMTESILICENCLFVNNSAGFGGGALFHEQESSVILRKCVFRYNYVVIGGSACFFAVSQFKLSVIDSCVFEYNYGGIFGTILSQSVYFTMSNSTFRFNYALECSGITLQLAFAAINDSEFYSMEGGTATFLGLYVNSAANISHSSFSQGRCRDGGLLYVSSNSSLSVYQCSFRNLTVDQGGVLSVLTLSRVLLKEVSMQHIRSGGGGSLLTVSEAEIEIYQSTFQDFKGTGISGHNVFSLTVLTSDFEDGEGALGAAIYLSLSNNVLISSCTFSHLHATYGGVLYLDSAIPAQPGIIALHDITCVNNSAQRGGVLYATSHHVKIFRGTFVNNSAEIGGALYLDCNAALEDCSFLISQCRFETNSATLDGGAIAWKAVKPNTVNSTFSRNTAQYGVNLSSFPVALLLNASNTAPVAPGWYGELYIKILLLDHYEQVVKTDNSSVVTIKSDSLEYEIVGITEAKAVSGEVRYNNVSLNAKPDSTVKLIATGKANDQLASISPISFIVQVRPCLKGEFQTSKSCEMCSPGTYSFDPTVPCEACLPHASCLGGAVLVPDKGYWRSGAYSPLVRVCPNTDACKGGESAATPERELVGECAIGYKGNLCQSCADGFTRSGKNECEQCPSRTDNYVRLSLIALAAITALLIIVIRTMKFAIMSAEIDSILLRILWDHTQLQPLVVECNFGWPELVLKFYQAEIFVGGVGERAFSSPNCLLSDEHVDPNLFFKKQMLVALLPIIFCVLSAGYWTAVAIRRFAVTFQKQECIATVVIMFFMVLPFLLQQTLSMFSCTEIEPGEYWLTVDLDVRCWDHAHRVLLLSVCTPTFIVWVLGAPLLCVLILVKNSKRHDEIWIKRAYGFLINGYKRRYYLWEFLVYSRKLLIILAVVFLTNNVPVQALTTQLVFILALFLQIKTQPYTLRSLNISETFSLLVSNVTIFCGLFFLTKELTEEAAWLFFLVIIATNFVFFSYMIYVLGSYYWKKLLEICPVLRRIVGLEPEPDPYIEEFLAMNSHIASNNLPAETLRNYRLFISDSRLPNGQIHVLKSFETITQEIESSRSLIK